MRRLLLSFGSPVALLATVSLGIAADCDFTCPAFADKINNHCVGSGLCHDWVCNPAYDSSFPGKPTRTLIEESNVICKSILEINVNASRTLSELESGRAVLSDFSQIINEWTVVFSNCNVSEESKSVCWENLPRALGVLAGFRAAFSKVAETLSIENEPLKAILVEQIGLLDEAITRIQSQVGK